MKLLKLTVNGQDVEKAVSDRTHLGDFLRDSVQLTGTHLGCEHGVCGACTVLLDGEPVRSCITYALACEGRSITTIEGYAQDPVMLKLRIAFTAHHALQCGYCTPGMLATARDIVLRLPDADEQRVRIELAGNLCRCTGYMGIVSAIMAVLKDLHAQPDAQIEQLRRTGAGQRLQVAAAVVPDFDFVAFEAKRSAAQAPMPARMDAAPQTPSSIPAGQGTQVQAFFELAFPLELVWAFMSDLNAVASCLPGAHIEAQTAESVEGHIAIKFGPMSATFKGRATIQREQARHRAVLQGTGQDSLSQSRANGDVQYQLQALDAGHTRVEVVLLYTLQGPLAQFSRSGLVQEFVRRMVADFGKNVTQRLTHPQESDANKARAVNPLAVLASIVWSKIKRLFGA